jgi:hypothetical protein
MDKYLIRLKPKDKDKQHTQSESCENPPEDKPALCSGDDACPQTPSLNLATQGREPSPPMHNATKNAHDEKDNVQHKAEAIKAICTPIAKNTKNYHGFGKRTYSRRQRQHTFGVDSYVSCVLCLCFLCVSACFV